MEIALRIQGHSPRLVHLSGLSSGTAPNTLRVSFQVKLLQTVIAASHSGLTLELSLGRGHQIYQLLKDVFDPIDEAQPASII